MQFDRAGSPRVLNRLQGGVEMPTALKRRLRWGAAAAVAALAAAGVFAAVASAAAPENTASPAISGTATEGSSLTASTGTWTNSPASFASQWPRYGVRSADVGHRLRALVTAHNSSGVATAVSNTTAVVTAQTTTVTTTTTTTSTTTVAGNRAPSIRFLSLRRVGVRVFARFRICDDHIGRVSVIVRDNKARALSARRRFGVTLTQSCAAFSRSWVPAARFRSHGRLVVTVRAIDR